MNGRRLDLWLVAKYPSKSRSYLQKLITNGKVKVNSVVVESSKHLVTDTDEIEVSFPKLKDIDELGIEVILDQPGFMAINKPAGVLVHGKSQNKEETTLVDWLKANNSLGEEHRYGLVHRLDRQTSGVMLVAKTKEYFELLQANFMSRKVKKYYIAITEGKLEKDILVDKPVARKANSALRQVDALGKKAQTNFYPIKDSVVLAIPKTGRTHQIRVHLAHLGHPIVGDEIYGGKAIKDGRILLHAYGINPGLKQFNQLILAKLPEDMSQYIDDEQIQAKIASTDGTPSK